MCNPQQMFEKPKTVSEKAKTGFSSCEWIYSWLFRMQTTYILIVKSCESHFPTTQMTALLTKVSTWQVYCMSLTIMIGLQCSFSLPFLFISVCHVFVISERLFRQNFSRFGARSDCLHYVLTHTHTPALMGYSNATCTRISSLVFTHLTLAPTLYFSYFFSFLDAD